MVFVSGLDLVSESSEALGPLQLAVDWLCGEAGEMEEQERNAGIERVIVAGNLLGGDSKGSDSQSAKYLSKDKRAESAEGVRLADEYLVQLAAAVDVDVMPGQQDPANQLLPQQPLHPCLFPRKHFHKLTKHIGFTHFCHNIKI